MKWCRAGLLCLLAAAILGATAGRGLAVSLPFEESFEGWPVAGYPTGDGWKPLFVGKMGLVSSARAHTGLKSFLMDSSLSAARADYVRLDELPESISYEASVYVDPNYGKSAMVGFMNGSGVMSNFFTVDGKSHSVSFAGANPVYLGAYTAGAWCLVHADLDFGMLKGTIAVNGVVVAEEVDLSPSYQNLWGMQTPKAAYIRGATFTGNVVYVDDVVIEEWVRTIPVSVDIKPGSDPVAINPKSRGVTPVAILSDEEFDATQIDPSTVLIGGTGLAQRGRGRWMAHMEDVNGDGLVDLLVQAETQGIEIGEDGTVTVTGMLWDGRSFAGMDEVAIVPG